MTATQPQRRRPGFQPGTSGNPAGGPTRAAREAARAAVIAEWTAPYGGIAALRPAELALLHQAAELSLRRPRGYYEQLRVANTISKIMAQCGLAHKAAGPRKASEPQHHDDGDMDAREQMSAAMAEEELKNEI